MKHLFLFITALLISFGAYAQFGISFKLDADTVRVPKYEFTGLGTTQTYFQMSYAAAKIYNPGAHKYFKDKIVERVELIYTDYPKGDDLTELTKRRLAALYVVAPELFENPSIEWRLVAQTDYANSDQVYDMFHGFAITYRPTTTLHKDASERLVSIMSGKTEIKDSTVLRVLNRNEQWKEMLVVGDLTGSMSPFAAQILLWHKLNHKTKRARYFVFFNDGDAKRDDEKRAGKTGGIYTINATSLDEVLKMAAKTIDNGSGGDIQENDLEAVLSGINTCKGCESVVLIADNAAAVRDMELLRFIKKPVKVVLCGVKGGTIHPDYLKIARHTGGSLHTIDQDIDNLMELNEGESIEIGGRTYAIIKGELVYVPKG